MTSDAQSGSLDRADMRPRAERTSDVERAAWWADGWYRAFHRYWLPAFGPGAERTQRRRDIAATRYGLAVEREVVARRQPHIDPKLSDGGAWRGACPSVERTEDAQM